MDAAKARGVHVITLAFLHEVRDKRAGERPPSRLSKIQTFFP
ncbi:MAG: hypothetical protein WCJ30_07305 [Deltaproteobacteria bacterium]